MAAYCLDRCYFRALNNYIWSKNVCAVITVHHILKLKKIEPKFNWLPSSCVKFVIELIEIHGTCVENFCRCKGNNIFTRNFPPFTYTKPATNENRPFIQGNKALSYLMYTPVRATPIVRLFYVNGGRIEANYHSKLT